MVSESGGRDFPKTSSGNWHRHAISLLYNPCCSVTSVLLRLFVITFQSNSIVKWNLCLHPGWPSLFSNDHCWAFKWAKEEDVCLPIVFHVPATRPCVCIVVLFSFCLRALFVHRLSLLNLTLLLVVWLDPLSLSLLSCLLFVATQSSWQSFCVVFV